MWKRISIGAVAALLALQFLRPAKNLSASPPTADDFIVRFAPPSAVAEMLRQACYDCHSDGTRYPAYAEIQPVGWWLAHHVNEGRQALNFSRFGGYPAKKQARKLSAIADRVSNREMPLRSYALIHRAARLTDAQAAALSAWMDDLHDRLAGAGAPE